MSGKKRGGQPGNENAVTHGRHSRRQREERRVAWEQRMAREREWASKAPQTDYSAICRGLLTAKEAFSDLPVGFDGVTAAFKAGKGERPK